MKTHKLIKIISLSILVILIGITIISAIVFEKRGRSDLRVETLCDKYQLNLYDLQPGQISKVQGFFKHPYYEITQTVDDYYIILRINGDETDVTDKNICDTKTLSLPAGDVILTRVNVASEGAEMFTYFHLENQTASYDGFLVKPQDEEKTFHDENYAQVSNILSSIF